jgi:hypothetical protein
MVLATLALLFAPNWVDAGSLKGRIEKVKNNAQEVRGKAQQVRQRWQGWRRRRVTNLTKPGLVERSVARTSSRLGRVLESRRARKLKRKLLSRDPQIRDEFRWQRSFRVPRGKRLKLAGMRALKPLAVLYGLRAVAGLVSGDGVGAANGLLASGLYAAGSVFAQPSIDAIRSELAQTGTDAILKFSDNLDPAERLLLDRYSLLD